MHSIREDADRLVDADGTVRFGVFDRPFETLNMDEADAWRPVPSPKFFRRLRMKEWEAFQITHERYFILMALFDAKIMQVIQVKLYDRQTKTKHYFEKKVRPGTFRTARGLLDSVVEWRSGANFIRMENQLAQGQIRLSFDLAATKTTPAMKASLESSTEGTTPLVVSLPFHANRGMYSHKALLPLTGTLNIGDDAHVLAPGTASLMTDDHKGYYGRLMTWDWAVGAQWRDGRLEGFNLTTNAALDPERFNENAFWLGGERHLLPAVQWTREDRLWCVKDAKGLVDVRFHIEAEGNFFLNLGIAESRYLGPIGHFEGRLTSPDGASLVVDGMFGMGERFWLKS